MEKKDAITYHYTFKFGDGTQNEFNLKLNKKTLDLIQEPKSSFPKWTELTCHQCPNCTLKPDQHKCCPIALNLVDLVNVFKDSQSFEKVDVIIETEVRKYMRHTTLQKGLGSLIGIYMTTSGCPIMEKLKPMVRFHLPFATLEETRYRVLSMYCLAQYFLYKHGKTPDWELKDLVNLYEDVHALNQAFCKRLSYIKIEDASVNAVVVLNNFADYVTLSIDKEMLDEVEILFHAYFK